MHVPRSYPIHGFNIMFSVLVDKLQNTGPCLKSSSVARLSRRVLLKRERCKTCKSLVKCRTEIRNRGYYMLTRGYEFYLRVFNSIYHKWAQWTSEIIRVEHSKIKFVSSSGHVIFCLYYTDTNGEMLWCSFPIGWDWSSHDNHDIFTCEG